MIKKTRITQANRILLKTMRLLFLLTFIFLSVSQTEAKETFVEIFKNREITIYSSNKRPKKIKSFLLNQITPKMVQENPKLVALILTATLGPFGAHRIYLGTNYQIPIFYTITLGGGLGALPAVDFFVLLFTKDISKFYNNEKLFMWM